MTRRGAGDLRREIESLRALLSKLSEASCRVSQHLDVNVVLQEVIDNARYLTGARYGALLTYQPSGSIQDFITSGLSPQEIEAMNVLPQGRGLLGHLNEIREPLRLSEIASHPGSVGFPENHPPMKTFLGMPIHHFGEHVGNIYLAEKDGGRDFTAEDEDVLVMFASQAGSAIANARRYREEHRARADLEALLNISPVGVLVFDGKTGVLVKANDETRRVFGSLNQTGRTLEEITKVVALRRADGSDIPIEEIPVIRALTAGENVFADEVVIHLPNGQAITTLINARPIRRDDGEVESVVATIQDITPLEAVKRQRAEFLQNLSHELRTPLSAIKGSTSTLLGSPNPLGPDETRQFLRVIDEQSDQMRQLINDLVDMTHIESGTLSVRPEPTELADLLEEAREARVHTSTATNLVEIALPSGLPRVMIDRRRILQVLDILLARAAGYTPGSSVVKIDVARRDPLIAVTVHVEGTDTPTLLTPRRPHGNSRVAGNGREDLSLAVCAGIVEAHGSRLSVEDGEGDRRGSVTFTVPLVDEAAQSREPATAPSNRDPLGARARILAVGDNPATQRYLRNTISQAGFIPLVASDPDEVELIIADKDPHVVILEPTLPRADGFEMLAQVTRISDAPIIFVAGPGWERQIGRAFELGAFDYIAKPFTATELLARIDVALRRRSAAGSRETSGQYQSGDLSINYAEREVSIAGHAVHLSATEYRLLTELSTASGRALTHEQLLRRVWGPLHSTDSRILRTYVKELRRKLGDDAAHPEYIFTELGVGYRMARSSST